MLAGAHRSSMCVLGGAVGEPGMSILAIVSMDQKTKLASKFTVDSDSRAV
jgi:hypothetical protein